MRGFLFVIITFSMSNLIYSQRKVIESIILNFNYQNPITEEIGDNLSKNFLSFENAQYDIDRNFSPFYIYNSKWEKGYNPNLEILNHSSEVVDEEELSLITKEVIGINEGIDFNYKTIQQSKNKYLIIRIYPYFSDNGIIKKINSIEFEISPFKGTSNSLSVQEFKENSVLSTGDWYRFSTNQSGIHQITYDDLAQTGMDLSNVNPENFAIYGFSGGMMIKENSFNHMDDLEELAVFVQGEQDGILNSSDYILFYTDGPNKWQYDQDSYYHEKNVYSDSVYFYLTIKDSSGKRIANQGSLSSVPTDFATTFDELQYHERDLENLIKTGSEWFGESFEFTTTHDFSFSVPNIDNTSDASVKINVVARSTSGGNYFNLYVNNNFATDIQVANVSGLYYSDYVKEATEIYNISSPNENINLRLDYSKPTNASLGYLNYIELICRRALILGSNQLDFRDSETVGPGNITQFTVENVSSNTNLWDVTDPQNVKSQEFQLNGNEAIFVLDTDSLREFVAFNSTFHSLNYVGQVENQNLHSSDQTEMIIITHPKFLTEAERLAQFHRDEDEMSVLVVKQQEVFNEFSGGRQDVMGIRNFMRMFYTRAISDDDRPKYLLLFGDGSYDPKNRLDNNTNYILCYQSENSTRPTNSYVSDDFFVLLDEDEGEWDNGIETIDMGVGRFPVQTVQEAREMVDKTIRYANNSIANSISLEDCGNLVSTQSNFGSWRNRIVFIADDEDGNVHISQSDQLSTIVDTMYQNLNIDKIYFDAYSQESTPGGDRYPEVNNEINRVMQEGALIVNYTGHGGELGWAHERVLEISDIEDWDNTYRMPVLMTATCEFSRFDDPGLTSAGELVVLNPIGGAVAMFTTVRLVYSSPNFTLNQNFYLNLIDQDTQEIPRLGDIFMRMKRASGGSSNHRNFTLLGDPAIKLTYPERNVSTISINDFDVEIYQDTLSSLEKVKISGEVLNESGELDESFNGIVYPTVFDKKSIISTLANDGGSTFNFLQQNNILYKGKSTVSNGTFEFSFIVPKDIAYNFDKGRISYYVLNEDVDGAGYFENVIIGGTSDSITEDSDGPEIELFINNEDFAFGGTTDETPVLIALLSDSSGLNTVGNGIGHDMVAVLNEETTDPYVLNDFYEANIDDYQSGEIRYRFDELEEGRHQLKLKVWDVHNNSSEAYTEFVVASSENMVLEHVLNYPNPFTTSTEFFFEHNQACAELLVQVQIYTVSGKLVKTINTNIHNDGYRSDGIHWDGLDDYGDPLAKGVYVYKIKAVSPNGNSAHKFEKLVILR